MTRSILAVANDFQVGSSTGILDPDSLLSRWDDVNSRAYEVQTDLNPAQKYLFDLYQDGLNKTKELAGNDPVYFIFNGDFTQGNRFKEFLSYPSMPDQVQIAADLICRSVKTLPTLKVVRMTRSTQVHAYEEGVADNAVLQNVRGRYPELDAQLVSQGLMNIGGLWVDYGHHGPAGGNRSWLKGNVMTYYAKSVVADAMRDNEPIPNLIVRAHKHERVEISLTTFRGDERVQTVAMTVPSFQLMTPHAQKVTQSEPICTNGMVALELTNGRIVDIHWLAQTRRYQYREEL